MTTSVVTSSVRMLFERAVRRDFFIRGPHVGRLALLGLILLYQVLLTWPRTWSVGQGWKPTGEQCFAALCVLDLVFISLASVLFATLITGEKEERTLDMLRLTGSAPQILLGVSWPGLVSAGILFLVQYPFFNLAAHLGGVIPRQILVAYCGLFSFLLLAWSLALFASVFCGNSSSAMSFYCGSLLLLLFGGPIGKIILGQYTSGPTPLLPPVDLLARGLKWGLELASIPSAFGQLEFLTAGPLSEPIWRLQTCVNLALSAILFALTCLLFEWAAGRACGSGKGVKSAHRRNARRWFRRYQVGVGRAWSNPLIWKDFHFIGGGWLILAVKSATYGGLAGLIWMTAGNDPEPMDVALFALSALGIIALIFEIMHIAGLTFRTESKERTLAGILILPHTTRWIAYSKIAGGLLLVLPAGCVACLAVCGAFYHGLTSQPNYVLERITAHWGWALVLTIEFVVWAHRNAALPGLPLSHLKWKLSGATAVWLNRAVVGIYSLFFLCLLGHVLARWWLNWNAFNTLSRFATPIGFVWGLKGCLEIVSLHFMIAEQLRVAAAE